MHTDTSPQAPVEPLRYCGSLQQYATQGNTLICHSNGGTALRLSVVHTHIVRVRYAATGHYDADFSYGISPDFQPNAGPIAVTDHPDHLLITLPQVGSIHLHKATMALQFLDLRGNTLHSDAVGYCFQHNITEGGERAWVHKAIQPDEIFLGLGDKPNIEANLRGKRFSMWGTDTYAYGPQADPLYKNIPFYFGLHQGNAYGIFLDNSFRTIFDFGATYDDWATLQTEGGDLNYYFIFGPQLLQVAERYTHLTGLPELPPLWALGYHQCRWSYYPEQKVRNIADTFRSLRIPCDALYLDIDYMDGYRCFTWDTNKFPQPQAMIADLRQQGFKTVVIIDPGIKIDPDYPVYRQGIEHGHFCRRADGAFMRGPVWPGYCHFPDFTNPQVRNWWRDLFAPLIGAGVAGVWNDMNEPALFDKDNFIQTQRTFPDDVRHHYEGYPCSHRKAHNIYGMAMSMATYEGVKKHIAPLRPFTITRSTYAGGQRYASGWTGDNVASWEHLRIANQQCQRLSISGMSFIGTDIGGFVADPDGELYTRWLQLGIFHPFCRTHSSKDHAEQEPWTWGQPYTDIARQTIELRYRLLPYLYTTFWQHTQRGTPFLRPLMFGFQHDPATHTHDEEMLVGDSLLMAPVTKAAARGRWIYLPKGADWYNWFNGKRHTGGQSIWCPTPLHQFPLFVRAGAAIPLQQVVQYIGEVEQPQQFLYLYYHRDGMSGQHYCDAGDTYAYQHPEGFRLTRIKATPKGANALVLTFEHAGTFPYPSPTCIVRVIGAPSTLNTLYHESTHYSLKRGRDQGLRYLETSITL